MQVPTAQATGETRVDREFALDDPRLSFATVVATIFAGLACLISLHSESASATTIHYLSLIAAISLSGIYLFWAARRRWSLWWSVAAALLVAVVWYRFDYYSTWRYEDDDNGTRYYTDYYWRSNGRLFYRKFHSSGDDGLLSAEGGFSESGKTHGHWTSTSSEDHYRTTHEWYWYGEDVSEGEWHLRNR